MAALLPCKAMLCATGGAGGICLPPSPLPSFSSGVAPAEDSWEALAKLPSLAMEQKNPMCSHHPDDLNGGSMGGGLRLGQILALLPTHRGLLGRGVCGD